jgi:DNA-binding transcriptional LysR family regulator
MDRLTSLSVFVAAVEEGSIAAAARRFELSPVMAGRYLSALEERLNARLLHRTTRQLSLTDAGRAYFARCKRILDDLEEADDEAAERQATPQGSLHLTAPITFGTMYLAPVAASYMADFPHVDVSLHLQDRFVDLVEEGMDVAVRIGRLAESRLVARKLADCPLMACAAPSYLAKAGVPHHPEDLAQHALIGYMGDLTTAQWTFIDRDGRSIPVRHECRFMANNTEMMAKIALAGTGVVYGPAFVFAEHLRSGALVRLLSEYSSPVLPLHAITPNAKHVNLKTRLFIERLRLAFAPKAPWHLEF